MQMKVDDNISKIPVKSINSDLPDLPTKTIIIQEKAKTECDNFVKKIIHFCLMLIIAYFFTRIIFKNFRKLNINEIISLNNEISFPFNGLYVNISSNSYIGMVIQYSNKKKIFRNYSVADKLFIDVKSYLNVSKIILEDEFDDYLEFFFVILKSNLKYLTADDRIQIFNGIYTLNMSEGNLENIKVNRFNRTKIFYIKEELNNALKNNMPRKYQYYVRSHSIKTLNEEYNFSVIDDNANIRELPMEFKANDSYVYFVVIFSKKLFYDKFEIVGDSFWNIFISYFGTVAAIYEFIIPLIIFLFHKLRLTLRDVKDKNQKEKKLLKDNESVPKTVNELNDINSEIIS